MPYLPHIYPVGATFFITFRLADSVPQHILSDLKDCFIEEEQEILQSNKTKKEKETLIYYLRKKTFGKYEVQLEDKPYGDCQMKDEKVAQIIWEKIFQFDDLYYIVDALCIMPNHVHMLLDTSIQLHENHHMDEIPPDYIDVSKWMQLIKGGSSFLINKYLKRSGTLWAKESYDHYIRYHVSGEYERIKNYIAKNPIKARLSNKFLNKPFLFVKSSVENEL